jgi:hypothetical protein
VNEIAALASRGERGRVVLAAHSAFAAGLNDLLIVTGGIALAGGLATMLLIRSRDFARARTITAIEER